MMMMNDANALGTQVMRVFRGLRTFAVRRFCKKWSTYAAVGIEP